AAAPDQGSAPFGLRLCLAERTIRGGNGRSVLGRCSRSCCPARAAPCGNTYGLLSDPPSVPGARKPGDISSRKLGGQPPLLSPNIPAGGVGAVPRARRRGLVGLTWPSSLPRPASRRRRPAT